MCRKCFVLGWDAVVDVVGYEVVSSCPELRKDRIRRTFVCCYLGSYVGFLVVLNL